MRKLTLLWLLILLALAAYRAVEEDGVWRWCGESQ